MATSPRRLAPSPATTTPATINLEQGSLSARLILSSFKELDIIAWLRLLRSIDKSRPGDDLLSPKQLNALKWLSSLPSNEAEEWLKQRRAQSLAREKDDNRIISLTNAGPRATLSLASQVVASRESVQSYEYSSPEREPIPESDQSQPISPDEALRNPPTSSGTRYWSTSEDSPQQFTTFDGFRRHENERERVYILLPDGVIEDSAQGPLCALCLEPDPDVKHFEMHKAVRFMEESRVSMKRSRKENFRRLLRSYNVTDEHVDRLVRKWHFTHKKQAYSCGLCVKLFATLLERTNHLAHDHYERGENRDGWDVSTLIRGLLLQPDILEEFRDRYDIDPSCPTFQLTWTSSNAHKLRDKLEARKEDPGVLAQAAYDAADLSDATSGYENVATTADQIPADTISASSLPPPMGDGAASLVFSTNQATGAQSTTVRFPNRTNSTERDWIKAKTSSAPLDAWNSLPREFISSGPLEPMANSLVSQETIPTRVEDLFDQEAVEEALTRSTSRGEAEGDQEHGIYMPNSFVNPSLADEDQTLSSNAFWEQGHWLRQPSSWSMAPYDENALIATQGNPMAYPTLKRKHSVNATGASSSKSFVMSSHDDYPHSNHHQPNYEQK